MKTKTITCFLFIGLCLVLLACGTPVSHIYGNYRIYSDDPDVQRWIMGEQTYLQVNEDQTIVYNNTLNGKPKFHFTGTFELDAQTNTLTIKWNEGKLPGQLQVKTIGDNQIIQIGTTSYKKSPVPGN